MVFMPPWSLVLVNKSEVLLKSLDKQQRGDGESGHQCWEEGST